MSNVLVLIPTCTAFADTWSPGIDCIKKFWRDCPHDRLWLIAGKGNPYKSLWPGRTNGQWFCSETVPDIGWSATLADFTRYNGVWGWCDFMLLFLDDMFLCAPPDEGRLNEAIGIMCDDPSIAAIQLYQRADEGAQYRESTFRVLPESSAYRVTTGPCLWRTKTLTSLAARVAATSRGTAWDFGLRGNDLVKALVILSCGEKSVVPVQFSAITRGEWEPGALGFLRKEGIAVDTMRRKTRGH